MYKTLTMKLQINVTITLNGNRNQNVTNLTTFKRYINVYMLSGCLDTVYAHTLGYIVAWCILFYDYRMRRQIYVQLLLLSFYSDTWSMKKTIM